MCGIDTDDAMKMKKKKKKSWKIPMIREKILIKNNTFCIHMNFNKNII